MSVQRSTAPVEPYPYERVAPSGSIMSLHLEDAATNRFVVTSFEGASENVHPPAGITASTTPAISDALEPWIAIAWWATRSTTATAAIQTAIRADPGATSRTTASPMSNAMNGATNAV